MAKLADQPLEELYKRDKITPAAFKAIAAKEDFSTIKPTYCERACNAPCYMKDPDSVTLFHRETDIMVLQSHPSFDDLWRNGEVLDSKYESIMNFMFSRNLKNMTIPTKRGGRQPHWRVHNSLKCQPFAENRDERDAIPFGKRKPLPENPALTATKIARCAPYLMEEIRRCKPKVIISTSTGSTKALGFKHLSNYKHRGWVDFFEIDDMKIPVVITLHPEITTMIRQNSSGQMWGPDYFDVIERDFIKAANIACGNVDLKPIEKALQTIKDNNQIVVTESVEEVKHWMDKLKALSGTKAIISWDTETTSLDPWYHDARFLCHQFGYTREDGLVQAIVVPLWHRDNEFYKADDVWPMVEEVLVDPDILKVAHNAAFDLKWTRVVKGVEVEGLIGDTMLIVHALNSGISGNYSLKTSVWDYLLGSGLGGYEDHLDIELAKQREAEEAQYLLDNPPPEKPKAKRVANKAKAKPVTKKVKAVTKPVAKETKTVTKKKSSIMATMKGG